MGGGEGQRKFEIAKTLGDSKESFFNSGFGDPRSSSVAFVFDSTSLPALFAILALTVFFKKDEAGAPETSPVSLVVLSVSPMSEYFNVVPLFLINCLHYTSSFPLPPHTGSLYYSRQQSKKEEKNLSHY